MAKMYPETYPGDLHVDDPEYQVFQILKELPETYSVIERLKVRERVGSVFSIGSPYRALVSACERLGFSHYDVYRLRHYFATVCLESGVDVPTVALWMGHSDGGKFLLEVYQHVRRSHSQEQAMKVRFA